MVAVCHRTQVHTSDCKSESELNTSTRSSFEDEKKQREVKKSKERLNLKKQMQKR